MEARDLFCGSAFGALDAEKSLVCPRRIGMGGWGTYKDVHLGQHVVCGYELVGDAHALWFHGVGDTVGVCANVGWAWTSEAGKGK